MEHLHTNVFAENPSYSGIEDVLQEPKTDVRIFNKPTTRPYRRMAVVLTYDKINADVDKVKDRAINLARKINKSWC